MLRRIYGALVDRAKLQSVSKFHLAPLPQGSVFAHPRREKELIVVIGFLDFTAILISYENFSRSTAVMNACTVAAVLVLYRLGKWRQARNGGLYVHTY